MNTIQHNLSKEQKLIELFGYSLVGPDGSNRWLILDENEKQVGYIQYKKLHNANVKKGHSKIFGYHTVINSSKLIFDFTKKTNDVDGSIIDSNDYAYSFDIKRSDQDTDHVKLNMGDYPSLTIWSNKYGYINFKIDYKGLYLNYKSNTDNYNIEEILVYKNVDDEHYSNKEYVYQLRYCKKELELSSDNSKGIATREISGVHTPYHHKPNIIRLSERTWVNGKLINNRKNDVEGTIEEMAIKHQMGIDCFNRFRFLINQIIVGKQDIISTMVRDDIIHERGLSIFFSSFEKENIKEEIKNVNVLKRTNNK